MSAGLFAIWCELSGFDLGAFDSWLGRLPACGAREELTARRALAETALLTPPSNPDAALRHLEWLMLRRREIQREDAILPLAKQSHRIRQRFEAARQEQYGTPEQNARDWAEYQQKFEELSATYPLGVRGNKGRIQKLVADHFGVSLKTIQRRAK